MTVPAIISMTSIPGRIDQLGLTLASLRAQIQQPDEIRLYVSLDCDASKVPGDVRVIRVVDRGPVTKLSAVLDEALPDNAIVVTVDDDQVYAPDWLGRLLAAALEWPDSALGFAGWNVDGFLRDPELGEYQWASPAPCACDVLEGWAGALYRPRFFQGSDILNPPALFRHVDDVWISSQLEKNSTPRIVVAAPRSSDAYPHEGLHNRPDFVDLNRRAAIMGFS